MLGNTLEVIPKDEGENYAVISFWGNLDSFGLSEKRAEITGIVDSFSKTYLVFSFADLNFLNS